MAKKVRAKKAPTKATKTDQHGLEPRDYTFLKNRIEKGKRLADCYKAYNPKTTQNIGNQARSGWAVMANIKKKLGSWKEVYGVVGLGPDRLVKVYHEALEAKTHTDIYVKDEKTKETQRETILAVDHTTRLRAAKDLANIQGIGENVNVNVDITAKDITDNVPFVEKIAAHMAAYDRENNAD